jgi:hypothetical protein
MKVGRVLLICWFGAARRFAVRPGGGTWPGGPRAKGAAAAKDQREASLAAGNLPFSRCRALATTLQSGYNLANSDGGGC